MKIFSGKYRLFCLIIVCCSLLQGCGEKEKVNIDIEQNDGDATYIAEGETFDCADISVQGIEGKIIQCCRRDDMLYLLSAQQEETHIYITNLDGSNTKELSILEKDEIIKSFYVDDEKNFLCLMASKEEVFPTEVLKLDKEGNEIARKELKELMGSSDKEYLNHIVVDGVGNIILADAKTIYVLDSTMQSANSIVVPQNKLLINFIKTKSGNLACAIEESEVEGDTSGDICILDLKNKEWGKSLPLDSDMIVDEYCMMEGQEYEFYIKNGAGIYGYIYDDNEWTQVLDARCSLLTFQDMKGMCGEEKGQFLRVPNPDNNDLDESVLELYSKSDPTEQESKKIITLAGYNVTSQMRQVIRQFNKTHTDCKVVVKIYDDEDQEKLALDIMTGKGPDIFSISALQMPMESLVRKGILEDLTPFFESDPEVNMEDITPSVLESLKINDRLYCVTPYYFITSVACRASDAEGRDGWNFEEMRQLLKKKGKDEIAFSTLDKQEILCDIIPDFTMDFVDWKTGKCDYDNKDFKDLLEFCNEGMDIRQESDYEKMQEIVAQKEKEGKVLLVSDLGVQVYGIQVYRQQFGENIAYIGFPEKGKNGSYFVFGEQYGISASSKVKQEAWEVLRNVMSEEYQTGAVLNYADFYPTRENCLDWKFRMQMAEKPYEDEYGNAIEPMEKDSWTDEGGRKIEIGPASQEDVDVVMNLIRKTNKRLESDDVAANIVGEEVEKYFAGEQSLNRTTDIIQNRMKTYVNEQK